MNNHNFANLSKKALLEAFKQERQEMLAAGMSEADIFRIHFGEMDEHGKLRRPQDGSYSDYHAWLDERKHTRPDHKYAPGVPIAIDAVDPDGAWLGDGRNGLDEVEFNIDLKTAMDRLTAFQRFCFVEVCLKDRKYTDVAESCGKHHSTIQESVKAAKEKLKRFFS
jgi:hypothetical protein